MIQKKTPERIIDDLLKRIISTYRPLKVVLFGSYAYGNPTDDSDIDLFIIKETREKPIARRVKVRGIANGITGRIPFDSIVLTPSELDNRIKIGDQFIAEILTRGKVIYAKS